MPHYVYILECSNGNYYTGYTTDVTRRYQEHQAGSAKCKYTRAFPPKKIAAVWEFENKSDALRAECDIKSLSKKEKENLISHALPLSHLSIPIGNENAKWSLTLI